MSIPVGFNYHSDELSTEDKVTLYIVEGYLDFKVHLVLENFLSRTFINFSNEYPSDILSPMALG